MGLRSLPTIVDIHPVIRILCLLIVGFFVVSAKPAYLITTAIFLLIGFSSGAWAQLLHCGRVLIRLKWLFISIFLIYISLTPGQTLFPSDLSPRFLFLTSLQELITYEGLYLGALRVCSLIILIMAVNLFIQADQHSELSYAIIWLLSPLKRIGFPVDRLAIRISLTFKYVSEFQLSLFAKKQTEKDPAASDESLGIGKPNEIIPDKKSKERSIFTAIGDRKAVFHQSLNQAIDRSVVLVEKVLSRVNESHAETIERPKQIVPELYQWLLPIALLGVYVSI